MAIYQASTLFDNMARKKLLLGNWKMNKTIAEAKEFAIASLPLTTYASEHHIDIGVAPVFLGLDIVKKTNPHLIVAAQTIHELDKGAFTGEISVPMLKEIGITWSLVGHSERRTYNAETNPSCNKKVLRLVQEGFVPVYCVGETLGEFEAGKTKAIVEEQVRVGMAGLTVAQAEKVVVAYEPVWSIGTGKNASKEIAQDVCGFIRHILKDMFGASSEAIRILYGGSVKPNNVKEYLSQPDIDGALVGGASLAVDSYSELVKNIAE